MVILSICNKRVALSLLVSILISGVISGCLGVSTNNQVPTPQSPATEDSWTKAPVVIPPLTVYDLEGEKHSFPEEFKDSRTLLLLAFKHEQQSLLNPWLTATTKLIETTKNFKVIEMPTIESSSAAFRAMVNNGMRSGIDDEAARRRTMTLYVNKREFLDTLGIKDETKVYAVLVDESGKVIWRYDGSYSPEALMGLVQALD